MKFFLCVLLVLAPSSLVFGQSEKERPDTATLKQDMQESKKTVMIRKEVLGADKVELADLVVRGMKDSRDRLVSGIFRINGKRKETGVQGKPDIDAPVKYFCAFDFSKNLFRFDRSDHVIAESSILKIGKAPGAVEASQNRYIVFQEQGKFIRTPKHIYTWSIYDPDSVIRMNGEAKPDTTSSPFDIRCVGQLGEGDLSVGTSYSECLKYCSDKKLIEVEKNDNDVFRLVWLAGNSDQYRRTIWFDKNCGYSPVRLELQRKDSDKPSISIESTWKDISGVWVPQSCRIKETRHSLDLQWEFDWETVNKPIPEIFFNWHDFDLKKQFDLLLRDSDD